MIKDRHLNFFIEKNKNVLFEGHAGVGKTQIILGLWKRHGLNYRYFSGATMDPWVDLVGVPKQVVDPITGESTIELITPRSIDVENVEAIFIDELNRAPKKVQNALMELIQFKTINGRAFPSLRFVWAAINPAEADGQSYNVYKMDNALNDRFHAHVKLPFQCNLEYFRGVFGSHVAEIAVDWWNNIPMDKRLAGVSPRRLDYALETWKEGGDIGFVLPEESRPGDLIKSLNSVSLLQELDTLTESGVESVRKFLRTKDNNFKVTGVFNKLSEATQNMVIQAMPDESIEANASSSVFYRHAGFMARYREVTGGDDPVTVEARDWKGVEDRVERLRQVASENGVPMADLIFGDTSENEGHGTLRFDGVPAPFVTETVKQSLSLCFSNKKFKSARSKAKRMLQVHDSLYKSTGREYTYDNIGPQSVVVALRAFHLKSDAEHTRLNVRYRDWVFHEIMKGGSSKNTSTRMQSLSYFNRNKIAPFTEAQTVDSLIAMNGILKPTRLKTIDKYLTETVRQGLASWVVATIAIYGETTLGPFKNYSEVFGFIEIKYPHIWEKMIVPNLLGMTFLPEEILVDSKV